MIEREGEREKERERAGEREIEGKRLGRDIESLSERVVLRGIDRGEEKDS